jgi:hypothetical protein
MKDVIMEILKMQIHSHYYDEFDGAFAKMEI